jgi:hypothetical protein
VAQVWRRFGERHPRNAWRVWLGAVNGEGPASGQVAGDVAKRLDVADGQTDRTTDINELSSKANKLLGKAV